MSNDHLVDVLVKNGKIVTPDAILSGVAIAIQGEKIVGVAEEQHLPQGTKVIDAKGNYILPGIIDPHIHLSVDGRSFLEDVQSDTKAAAAGGVTSVLGIQKTTRMGRTAKRMAEPKDVVPYAQAFPAARQIIEDVSHVDFGLTLSVSCDQHAEEIVEFGRASGVTSYKFYLGYRHADEFSKSVGEPIAWDDGTLFVAMENIAKIGGLATFHAENTEVARVLTERLKKAGRDDLAAWDERSPDFLEAFDVWRMAFFAKILGTRIYPVHLSSAMALEEARRARAMGVDIVVEVCPQYLIISTQDDPPGRLAKVNVPIRSKEDTEALWEGLERGDVQCMGTDHVRHSKKDKHMDGNIWEVRQAWPGVETLLPLMLSEGVNKGRISLTRLVQVLCQNNARTFGLSPKKGAIQVGSDADLVIVDLNMEKVISAEDLVTECEWSLYEGRQTKGWPVLTMLRGQVIYQDGKIVGEPRGKYLPREVKG